MSKPAMTISPERVARYDALVATQPEVARKGATMPYTSVNGNMFSFLSRDGSLALRLSNDARATFLEKFRTKLFMDRGAAFSEYVVVPETLWLEPKTLAKYFAASYAYAKTLKPKRSAKKQAKKKSGASRRPKRRA
jgi:hypothetical protein